METENPTQEQPVDPEFIKASRCSRCQHYAHAEGELGSIAFCTLITNIQICLQLLNSIWQNMKDLDEGCFISSNTYKNFVYGIKKDIEFAQDYGVVIGESQYGRKCFIPKQE